MQHTKEEAKLFAKYMKLAKKIIAKFQALANQGKIKENFGEKDYRIFKDKVNHDDDLSHSDKADLCGYLSTILSHINKIN